MPSLDHRQLFAQIERDEIRPLYLLQGEETFLVEDAVERLREKILSGGLADFNFNVFYTGADKIENVRDAVETLPMMAPRRLVILKQAQDLSANDLEQLLPLVENPVSTTAFVLVASKADMRKKFFKILETHGVSVKFQRPFENQLNPWIQQIAKRHGKQLSPEATELMKEWVGACLTDINNELAKVASYVGERSEIQVEDLRAVVSRVRVDTVFELVNCMGRGDCANSFMHLAHLLDSGQNEIGVLAMIIRHFRILLLSQEGLTQGLSSQQISARVGVHGFFIREYLEQARNQERRHLLHVYDVLLDTDRALKSSPLSSHLWLENLVIQACRSEVG